MARTQRGVEIQPQSSSILLRRFECFQPSLSLCGAGLKGNGGGGITRVPMWRRGEVLFRREGFQDFYRRRSTLTLLLVERTFSLIEVMLRTWAVVLLFRTIRHRVETNNTILFYRPVRLLAKLTTPNWCWNTKQLQKSITIENAHTHTHTHKHHHQLEPVGEGGQKPNEKRTGVVVVRSCGKQETHHRLKKIADYPRHFEWANKGMVVWCRYSSQPPFLLRQKEPDSHQYHWVCICAHV